MQSPRDNSVRANRLWLFGILGLALLIRIVYLWQYAAMPDWAYLTVDNWYHHNWARTIADGNIVGDTTYFRAPLYVWCLGLLYGLFGASLWVARIFGLVIGLVSVGLSYRLGMVLFDRKVGRLAALLHAVYPVTLYFEFELLLDPLFTLFVQLVLIQAVSWYRQPDKRRSLLLGVLIGLAAITRPTILVFLLALPALILWQKRRFKKPTGRIVSILIGAGLVVLPVTVRNIMVADDPVLISSQGGINLYIGNHLDADGLSAAMPDPLGYNWQIADVTFLAEQRENRPLKPGGVSSHWTDETFELWQTHPGHAIVLLGKKLFYNFTGREVSNNRSLPDFFGRMPLLEWNPLGFTVLFTLVGLGVIACWRLPEGRLLLYLAVVYVAATALFFFSSRFRLPLLPLYFVIAAAAPFDLWRSAKSLPVSLLYPAIGGVVALALTFMPLPGSQGTSEAISLNSRGLYHYHNNEFDQAAAMYRAALDADSSLVDLNLNLGATFLRRGQIDSAVYYFDREASLHPGRPAALANLASVALLQDRPEVAVALTDQALPLQPYNLNSNRVRLRAVFAVDTMSADRLLDEVALARRRTDNAPRLLLDAGLLLSERQLFDAAEHALLELVNNPAPPIETDDNAFSANFVHNAAAQRQRSARAYYQLGFIAGVQQSYYDAISFSKAAIVRDSTLAEAWVNLAGAYRSVGNMATADSVFTEAVERFDSHPAVERLKRVW